MIASQQCHAMKRRPGGRLAGDLARIVIDALDLLAVPGFDLRGIDDFTGGIHAGPDLGRGGSAGVRGGWSAGKLGVAADAGASSGRGTQRREQERVREVAGHIGMLP